MRAMTAKQRLAEWSRMHAAKANALKTFNDAKFGMVIHWGLYAIPGGVWKGQRMEEDGIGPCVAEWIMRRRSIPRTEYAKLAGRFNPDAVYGTGAWKVVREGPTELARRGTGQRERQGFTTAFTPQDFWFTNRGRTVYAIALASPADRRAIIRSMRGQPVAKIRMLGSSQPVSWEMVDDGLRVLLPAVTSPLGYALEIELTEQ